MARSVRAKANPNLLVWAREDAGYSIEEAARRIRVKPEALNAWESANGNPTIAQLRKLSELYKRPLALFFMKERPAGFMVMRDFRRLPGEATAVQSPELRIELRRAQERRRLAMVLARDLEMEVPRFTLRCALDDDPEQVGERVRAALQLTVAEQARWGDPRTGFSQLRRRLEFLGALVFIIPSLPTAAARGFSVALPVLPVVAVNRKDAWSARVFTLLHETTHVMLRLSGVCDLHERVHRPAEEDRVEIFCNAVAGAALIPQNELMRHPVVVRHARTTLEWTDDELEQLAASFGSSREAALRRLLTFGRTSRTFYQQKRDEYAEAHEQQRQRKKRQDKKRMRNVPIETVSSLGLPFLHLAFGSYQQHRITLNDLSEMLGVKARHIPKIEHRMTQAE